MAELYSIKKSTLTDFADIARNKSGETGELTINQMKSIFSQSGGGTDNTEALTEQLRASMTTNFGYDYNNKTFDELVGTYEPDVDGIIGTGHNYENGKIAEIKSEIGQLANSLDEDFIEMGTSPVNTSVQIIHTKLNEAKQNVVSVLNQILNPTTPFESDMPWSDLLSELSTLPTGVEELVNSALERWDDVFLAQTGRFANNSLRAYTGNLPYVNASNCNDFYGAMQSMNCEKARLNIGENATTLERFFYNNTKIKEFELIGSTANVTNFTDFMTGCTGLQKIIGVIDFSAVTTAISNFAKGSVPLVDVNFEPLSLNISGTFNVAACPVLSRDSTLSAINCLGFNSGGTIYFWSSVKNNVLYNWYCRETSRQGVYENCNADDENAVTFAVAIAEKGWNLLL